MNVFIIWLYTILISFGVTLIDTLIMIKDVANAGCKIKLDSLGNINNQVGVSDNMVLLNFLVPFYNIIFAAEISAQYRNNKDTNLDSLSVLGMIESMSEEEMEEYSKNPTLLNALLLSFYSSKKEDYEDLDLTDALYIKFHDDDSEAYFKINDDSNDITILKVIGPLSKLSENEQLEKVKKTWNEMQEGLDVNAELNEKESLVAREEQIQSLKDLKDEILQLNNDDTEANKKISIKILKKK